MTDINFSSGIENEKNAKKIDSITKPQKYNIKKRRALLKVNVYTKHGEYIKTYSCVKEAAKDMKVCKSSICGTCRGDQKTCKGLVLKYDVPLNYSQKIDYEIWKDVYINKNYEVSNIGRIRNKKTKRIRKLHSRCDGKEYIYIKGKYYHVGHLMVESFIEKDNNDYLYEDGNPKNDNIWNLNLM